MNDLFDYSIPKLPMNRETPLTKLAGRSSPIIFEPYRIKVIKTALQLDDVDPSWVLDRPHEFAMLGDLYHALEDYSSAVFVMDFLEVWADPGPVFWDPPVS